jgi:DnaJ-class molecular chaperone
MAVEPTVEVKLDPCPDCKGNGRKPPRVESVGMSRSMETGGVCERCDGQSKIVRHVPLSELRGLLDRPDEFR